MKKSLLFIGMIALLIIISACASGKSKEEVIGNIEKEIKDVKNYHTEVNVDVKITDTSNDQIVDESQSGLDIHLTEDPLESYGTITEDDQIVDFYSTQDVTYTQYDEHPWVDMTEVEEKFKNEEPMYENVAQILTDIKDEEDIEIEETDKSYEITFEGINETIFKAFQEPYDLSITGIDPKKLEQDVTIIVDKDTSIIEKIKDTLTKERDGHEIKLHVEQIYDEINKVDDISIPEKIIDEAT